MTSGWSRLAPRIVVGTLLVVLAAGAALTGAAFLDRPAVAASTRAAELQIADVRPVSSDPICPGTGMSFDVDVSNTGTDPATVALAAVGTRRTLIVRVSGVFTVNPGAVATHRVDIEPEPGLIRGNQLRPTILVVNANAPPNGGWLDQLFKDSNNNDHVRQVTHPLAPSRTVTVNLRDVRVLDDCDSVSPGDWMMHLGIEATGNHGVAVHQCMRRPARTGTSDVNTGTCLTIGSVQLENVSTCSNLTISVAAIDCDSDTLVGSIPLETWGLKNSCLTGRCGGEEFGELSGNHDRVGSITLTVPAATWTSGPVQVRAGITAIPNLTSVPRRVTHPNGVVETVSGSDCAILAPYNGLFSITPGG